MIKTHAFLALAAAASMTACSVIPEDSSQYTYAQNSRSVYAQPVNASYNSAQTMAADPNCLRQETNRKLIGGAIGGAAGAYAGKKLIGGNKGVIAGAALGGVAGYGAGDLSTNCAPVTRTNTAYQSAPTYSPTQASYESLSCPVGTTPHPSGTCLLNDQNASLQSETFQAAPTQAPQSYQRYAPAPNTSNVINAATAPAAPSAYMGTTVTRAYGTSGYRVKSGDTVYSLARNLCVPVTVIQSSNGLDANYGIQIGQSLKLPSSQC